MTRDSELLILAMTPLGIVGEICFVGSESDPERDTRMRRMIRATIGTPIDRRWEHSLGVPDCQGPLAAHPGAELYRGPAESRPQLGITVSAGE